MIDLSPSSETNHGLCPSLDNSIDPARADQSVARSHDVEHRCFGTVPPEGMKADAGHRRRMLGLGNSAGRSAVQHAPESAVQDFRYSRESIAASSGGEMREVNRTMRMTRV